MFVDHFEHSRTFCQLLGTEKDVSDSLYLSRCSPTCAVMSHFVNSA